MTIPQEPRQGTADQQSALSLVGSKVLIFSVPFLDSVSVTTKVLSIFILRPEKENSSNLSDNLALKGENLRKVKQRNFVSARNGFFSVIFMVLTTVVYDVIHMLPSSEYDAGR